MGSDLGATSSRSVALQADALTVEVVRDAADPALAAWWDPLVDEAHPGAVFRSSAWLLTWWQFFGGSHALHLLVAKRAGRPVALLPCYRVRTPLGHHRVRLLGDGSIGSDHLGLIAADVDRDAAARALSTHFLDEETDAWFCRVDEQDSLLRRLCTRADQRTIVHAQRAHAPFIALEGSFAAWLERLPNGMARQLLRRRRWLERRSDFRVEVLTDPSAIASGMEVLFQLHRARWAEHGGSQGIVGERAHGFHRAIAPELARHGWARLYLLHVGGAVRAALYGFGRGPHFAYYQSGLEPAWRARSVGTVLLCAAIEDAFARGLQQFDLLHGDEPYKSTLAASTRHVVDARWLRGRRAKLLWATARISHAAGQVAHRHLPTAIVDRLRHVRRRLDGGSA